MARFLFLSFVECNQDVNNMSFGKICILTAKKEVLNLDNVKVQWRNKEFIAYDHDMAVNEDTDDDSFVEESEFGIRDGGNVDTFSSIDNRDAHINVRNLPKFNPNDDGVHFGGTSNTGDVGQMAGEEAEHKHMQFFQ
ncbi:hypothetical protein L2E82_51283 [Cichorium intybus]|nr:hypothetical protein L2E82_51283 [Cichorium intybus]